MEQEGIIHYAWTQTTTTLQVPPDVLQTFLEVRDQAYRHRLLGVTPTGIAYGNLSVRLPDGSVLITGTGTSTVAHLQPRHLAQVRQWSLSRFWLAWQGETFPSSEVFSHLAAYEGDHRIQTILHTHQHHWWAQWHQHKHIPGTDAHFHAGTHLLAEEIAWLVRTRPLPLPAAVCMRGHTDGWLLLFDSLNSLAGWLNQPDLQKLLANRKSF